MLFKSLQCTECPPPTKNNLATNVKSGQSRPLLEHTGTVVNPGGVLGVFGM